MQLDARMLGQPGTHRECWWLALLSKSRTGAVGAGDLLEEGEELLAAVARGTLVDDPLGRDLHRGEQCGGPVPDVVVGALLGPVKPDRRTGWVRSKAESGPEH